MTDDKTILERDAVKRERAAYVRGSKARSCFIGSDPSTIWQKEAAEVYPLPKVKRPRVVTFEDGRRYRIRDGNVEVMLGSFDGEVFRASTTFESVADIRKLADLLDNPDELVDADD